MKEYKIFAKIEMRIKAKTEEEAMQKAEELLWDDENVMDFNLI